jgi:hypothetical protein
MDEPTGMIFERQRDRQEKKGEKQGKITEGYRTDVKATYRAASRNGYPEILHRQYPK